jgi:hypothetical protein
LIGLGTVAVLVVALVHRFSGAPERNRERRELLQAFTRQK